ncbi:MAG: cell envelope biogenesis protein OmpA, partial [Aestuariivirga sp.]
LDSQRFSVQGFGESQPVASNASASGKAQNRRVEIQIVPLT